MNSSTIFVTGLVVSNVSIMLGAANMYVYFDLLKLSKYRLNLPPLCLLLVLIGAWTTPIGSVPLITIILGALVYNTLWPLVIVGIIGMLLGVILTWVLSVWHNW